MNCIERKLVVELGWLWLEINIRRSIRKSIKDEDRQKRKSEGEKVKGKI